MTEENTQENEQPAAEAPEQAPEEKARRRRLPRRLRPERTKAKREQAAERKKVVRRSRKYHAHDEGNEAQVGDVVRIVETRPLSKLKRWRLAEIVEAAR